MTREEQQKRSLSGDHILCVLDSPAAAEKAEADLKAIGYEATGVFVGDDFADIVDVNGERSGVFWRLMKILERHVSEEPNFLAQYEEDAKQDKGVLAVKVDDRDAVYEIRDVLLEHGASNIRLFTSLSVSDLTPNGNPSAQSDESSEKNAGAP